MPSSSSRHLRKSRGTSHKLPRDDVRGRGEAIPSRQVVAASRPGDTAVFRRRDCVEPERGQMSAVSRHLAAALPRRPGSGGRGSRRLRARRRRGVPVGVADGYRGHHRVLVERVPEAIAHPLAFDERASERDGGAPGERGSQPTIRAHAFVRPDAVER